MLRSRLWPLLHLAARSRSSSLSSFIKALPFDAASRRRRWLCNDRLNQRIVNTEGQRYSVIKIDSSGVWETLSLNLAELKVHPRDMDVLIGTSFIPRRATIALRYERILIRTENVRALVSKDFCLLFDAHRRRKSKEISPVATASQDDSYKAAKDAFATSLAAAVREKDPVPHIAGMPFHLRILECLFEETSTFFNQKVERLAHVAGRALEELTHDVSMGRPQRLLPLRRALTEVEHDIRDTHEANGSATSSFGFSALKGLQDADSQKQWTKIRRVAADMLFTYLREAGAAG